MPQVVMAIYYAVAWLAAGSTAAALVKAILYVAYAAYGVQQSRKMKKALQRAMGEAQDRKVMVRDNVAPRRTVYGRIKVAGPLAIMHATGEKNEYLHCIVMLASHEIDAFEKFYVNEEEVTLDGGGNVTTGRYAGFVRIKKYFGTDTQTADADFIADTAPTPSVWTANHRLRGIAYLYARIKSDPTAFPNGLPNISALIRGKKIYDPRTSTTAWTANSALVLADYIRSDAGLKVSLTDIDNDELVAAANICDELITLNPSGTEKRYESHGSITTDQSPDEVIDMLRMAMSGGAIYSGGKWFIQAGAHRAPSLDLNESDMHGEISVVTRSSRRENYNAVKGVMVSAEKNYALIEFPPVKNDTYTSWDGGARKWKDVEYPFTISAATAQRLAKIDLEQGRQQIVVTGLFSLKALKVRAGSTLRLSFARYGFSNKLFAVLKWTFKTYEDQAGQPALGVEMTLQETAAEVWDWNNGEETVLDLAPNTNLPSSYLGLGVSALNVQSGTSHLLITRDGSIVPRLYISWVGPNNIFVENGGSYLVQVKPSASPNWIEVGRFDGGMTFCYYAEVVEGQSYDVRVQAQNTYGAEGEWIESLSHVVAGKSAAPNQPTSATASGAADGILIRWTNAADADLDLVEIYESSTSSPAPSTGTAPYASIKATSYFRGGLGPGVTRFYWLRSKDTSGNVSAWSGPYSASTTAGGGSDTTPPGDPTSLAVDAGFGTLWVTWTNPADGDLRHIRVYESTTTTRPSTPTYLTASSFLARTGLGDTATRYYWLQAEDASGNLGNIVGYISGTTLDGVGLENLVGGISAIKIVSSLPVSGDPAHPIVFLTTDKRLYRWDAGTSQWTAEVPSSAISGQLTNAQLAAIDAAKVSGQLTDAQLAAISAAKLTGQVTGTQIANGAITTAKLTANAVTANEIAAGAVVAGKIAANAVTASEISAGAITAAKIAAGAIDADKVAANAITADKISAGAITTGKLATDAVTAGVIQAGAITAAAIGTNTIITSAANIANAVITNAHIQNLSADKLQAGTISAAVSLTAAKVAGNTAVFNSADPSRTFPTTSVFFSEYWRGVSSVWPTEWENPLYANEPTMDHTPPAHGGMPRILTRPDWKFKGWLAGSAGFDPLRFGSTNLFLDVNFSAWGEWVDVGTLGAGDARVTLYVRYFRSGAWTAWGSIHVDEPIAHVEASGRFTINVSTQYWESAMTGDQEIQLGVYIEPHETGSPPVLNYGWVCDDPIYDEEWNEIGCNIDYEWRLLSTTPAVGPRLRFIRTMISARIYNL